MKIRIATQQDIPNILEYVKKENLDNIDFGLCLIAEEDGKVVGVINCITKTFIEPMMTDNSFVSRALYERMLGMLMAGGTKIVYAETNKEEVGEMIEHLEYKKTEQKLQYYKEI